MSTYTEEQIAAARAFHARESGRPDSAERRWMRWLRAAEALAVAEGGFRQDFGPRGSPLDGDEPSGDTFSLDGAYDAFERGDAPAVYIAACVARRAAA